MADLFDWQKERDEALERVGAHAEDECPGFAEAAKAFLLEYLAAHGPASGEVLTDACKAAGIAPHDDRAFGGCFMSLARAGKIVKIGTAIRTKGHGTNGAVVWSLNTGGS